MRLSDGRSLARGRGKGTVSHNIHDVQVKQIVIAAGETTEKVCMVTPRTGAMTMEQMMEIMRALQANVEASRIE